MTVCSFTLYVVFKATWTDVWCWRESFTLYPFEFTLFFTSAGKNLKYVTMTLYCSSSQNRIKSVSKALHASVWLCQVLDSSFTRTMYVVLFVFRVYYVSNFLQTFVSSYTREQIRNASCFWSHPTVDRDWRDNRVPNSFHT